MSTLLRWAEAASRLGPEQAAQAVWMKGTLARVLSRGTGLRNVAENLSETETHGLADLLGGISDGRRHRIEAHLGPFLLRHLEVQTALLSGERPQPEAGDLRPPTPRKIVILGDIHNKWQSVLKVLRHEFPQGGGTVLTVGDLVTYPLLEGGHQVFFIPGNHENFDFVATLPAAAEADPFPGYFRIDPGNVAQIGALRVAGLGGVLSPRVFNERSGPPKYFRADQVEAVANAAGTRPIDLLLMHEAPHGVGFRKQGEDWGKPVLTELMRRVQPRLLFFGHHHLDFEGRDGETHIVGLNYPNRSYLVLETDEAGESMTLRHMAAALETKGGRQVWRFPWESGMETGVTVLFGGAIRMETETRVLKILREKYLATVEQRLRDDILTQLGSVPEGARASMANGRAGLAVTTVLPHVAAYIARVEREPSLPAKDRGEIVGKIYDEMTRGLDSVVIPDLMKAFQYFLQAWGLVVS